MRTVDARRSRDDCDARQEIRIQDVVIVVVVVIVVMP
jgi:hypothetical protein